MNSAIVSFNNLLSEIEAQVAQLGSLSRSNREDKVVSVEAQLTDLENQVTDWQMRNPYKFDKEINEIESRAMEIHSSLDKLKAGNDVTPDQSKIAQIDLSDQRRIQDQQVVQRADQNLAEAKAIALGLVKTAEKMRDEINMIDDEVMLQQEKLVHINKQIKETQDITLQTKKIVRIVTLTVNQDKFIKSLIVLVAIALVSIIAMSIVIRVKQNRIEAHFNKSVAIKLDTEKPIYTKKDVETERTSEINSFLKSNSEAMLDKIGLREADFYPWLEVPFGVPKKLAVNNAVWETNRRKAPLKLAIPAKVVNQAVIEPSFAIFKAQSEKAERQGEVPNAQLKIPGFGPLSNSAKDQI